MTFKQQLAGMTAKGLDEALAHSYITLNEYRKELDRRQVESGARIESGKAPSTHEYFSRLGIHVGPKVTP